MTRFLAPLVAVCAVTFLAAMSPPVQQLVEGQQRIGGEIKLGSASTPVRAKGPLFIDSAAPIVAFTVNPDGGPSALTSDNNALPSSTKAIINYDFPAAQFKVDAFSCVDSPGATIANCPFGSQLLVGVDQVLSGGTGNLTPYLSAANTAFVRACAIAGDAGTFNMPDASYLVRCFP